MPRHRMRFLVVLLLVGMVACFVAGCTYKSTDVQRTPIELKHQVVYKDFGLKPRLVSTRRARLTSTESSRHGSSSRTW